MLCNTPLPSYFLPHMRPRATNPHLSKAHKHRYTMVIAGPPYLALPLALQMEGQGEIDRKITRKKPCVICLFVCGFASMAPHTSNNGCHECYLPWPHFIQPVQNLAYASQFIGLLRKLTTCCLARLLLGLLGDENHSQVQNTNHPFIYYHWQCCSHVAPPFLLTDTLLFTCSTFKAIQSLFILQNNVCSQRPWILNNICNPILIFIIGWVGLKA